MAASTNVRMVPGKAAVEGRTVHYAVSDNPYPGNYYPGNGAPVIPLHAGDHQQVWAVNIHGYFAGGGMYWRESARLAAATGWRVVNPSLPGFGGSDPLPRNDLSMAGLARTITGLLDALGAGPAVLFGHSMGGSVAIQFAHDFPERALGIVYRDGAATTSWKQRRSILAKLLSPLPGEFGTKIDLLSAVAADVPDLFSGRIRSTLLGVMPDARRNFLHAADALPVAHVFYASDLTEETAHVARHHGVPIFPVWGRSDRITPRHTAEEFSRVSGAETTWVRGGHLWMIARPDTQPALLLEDPNGRAFVRAVHDRSRLASTGRTLPANVVPLPTRTAATG